MRILFANDFGYLFGGAEVYAVGMAQALRDRGHEVRWLTSDVRAGSALFRLPDDAAPFHNDWFCRGTDSEYRLRRGLQQFHNRSASDVMKSAVRQWRPDVVHLHGFMSQLSPLVLGPLGGIAVVATAHTYKAICPRATKLKPDATVCSTAFGLGCVGSGCLSWAEYGHERLKRARFASHFDRIRFWIAPSLFVKSVFEAEQATPVRVLPHGTDLHQKRAPKENGKRIILFAGRLVDTKGIEVLLEAMVEVRRSVPQARLWIAGNGPCEEGLRRAAKNLGLGEAVEFLGYCDREKLIELHRKADVLAAPALWPEPLPLTVLESLALGTPVVATAVGGHGDAVVDGWNGRLVPPGNSKALADALVPFLSEDETRLRFEAASVTASERFRLDRLVPELESLYQEARQTQDPMTSWEYVAEHSVSRNPHPYAIWNREKLRGPRQGTREHGSPRTPHLS